MAFTVVGGVGYDSIDRSNPDPSSTRYADNDETSYRIELRKSMHETINGSFSYTYSDRESDILRYSAYNQEDWVAPLHMADRERDKYKLRLDWVPISPLSMQFIYEYSDDEYDLGAASQGVTEGTTSLISLDASYRINDDWTVNGWISRDETEYDRNQGSSLNPWYSNLEYKGDAIGLGVRGIVNWVHKVGADLQYGKDEASYGIIDTASLPADLPDTNYRYWRYSLYGEYVLDSNSGIRADYVYHQYKNDEWAWNDWVYQDGTTVDLANDEDVHFIGVSFYHRWR